MKLKPLYEYGFDIHSQNGEDGIINFLFEILKIDKGLLLEVGANDGVWCSNTRNLYVKNPEFKALLIEAEDAAYNNLLSNCLGLEQTEKVRCFISTESDHVCSLDSLLKDSKWNKEDFILASIDIDGSDYNVWKNLQARPKLVIIECPLFLETDPEKKNILQYIDLGIEKNYTFLGMSGVKNSHAGNLFFLVNELMTNIELPELHERVLLHAGTAWNK